MYYKSEKKLSRIFRLKTRQPVIVTWFKFEVVEEGYEGFSKRIITKLSFQIVCPLICLKTIFDFNF